MDIYRPTPELIGYEKERKEVKEHIKLNLPFIISGEYGVGKTSILLWIDKELKKEAIYIEGDEIRNIEDLEKKFKEKIGFFYIIFGEKMLKNKILLIDEADLMSKDALIYLKNLYDKGKIKNFCLSLIKKEKIPRSILERIGSREIILRGIDKEEILKFLERKFGKLSKVLNKEGMEYVWEISRRNPRKIIENFLKLLLYMKNTGKKKLGLNDIKKALGIREEYTPLQKKILEILSNDEKTIEEISKILKVSKSSVRARISELKKMGLIEERRGKPKKYKVKDKKNF